MRMYIRTVRRERPTPTVPLTLLPKTHPALNLVFTDCSFAHLTYMISGAAAIAQFRAVLLTRP